MSYCFGFYIDASETNSEICCDPSGFISAETSNRGIDATSLNPEGKAECILVERSNAAESTRSLRFVLADYPTATGASTSVTSRPLPLMRVEISTNNNNDLVPGVYEGGLKLWESSIDLLDYFVVHFDELISKRPNGVAAALSVIELGCGHGLPGLAALAKGCAPVLFSDFNEEVLRDVTWPNILRNASVGLGDPRSALCIAGDWARLSHNIIHGYYHGVSQYFDIILSAETLYCADSCRKVFDFIGRHLTPGGTALIATKRYYFGVGGGSYSFLELIQRQQYALLTAEIVAVFEDGSSNIREIISVAKPV